MRKFLLSSLVALTMIAQTAQADTIHLKNGSVLKGKVTSFADDQFVVMLDTGSGRYLSKAMVYTGDVARIEFDSAPSSPIEPVMPTQQPETSPRATANEPSASDTRTQVANPVSEAQVRALPPGKSPRETGPPADSQPAPTETTAPEKPSVSSPAPITACPAAWAAESDHP